MSISLFALLIFVGLAIPNAYSETLDVHAFCAGVLTNPPYIDPSQCQGRPGKRGPKGVQGIAGMKGDKGEHGNGTEDLQARLHLLEEKEKLYKKESADFQAKLKEIEQKYGSLLMTGCEKVSRHDAKVWSGTDRIFDIYQNGHIIEVYCDLTTDGGGWLVFQRRMDGSVDFYRNWNDYVKGFGKQNGEFWLGLQTIHLLTATANYELRIDLEDWDGNKRYATYSTFHVGNAASTYTLTVGGYAGNAGDSLARQNGMKFSTKDRDSDIWDANCAISHKGAWWYQICHESNLNGKYFPGGNHKSFADGIEWYSWKGNQYSMKFAEMKIRMI